MVRHVVLWDRTQECVDVAALGHVVGQCSRGAREVPVDCSIWHFVSLVEFSRGRLVKETVYFAPRFDAPEWRAPYAEKRPTVSE